MKKQKSKTTTSASSKFNLLQFIKSSRPISWVNTAFPFAAGYLATGGQMDLYFLVATIYFLIPYNVLIYVVNDVFDYESDLRNPRKNSIEGGLLPPETHKPMLLATLLINTPFLIYLLVNGSLATNLILLAITLGALSYSMPPLRFKEIPFLDSINSSFHFVSPLIFALMINGWEKGYTFYVLIFFAWGLASHAFGAVQDIIPDRQAKISSIATYMGARATVRLSLAIYVLITAALVLKGWPIAIIALPALGYVLMAQPFINLKDSDSKQANKGWRHFLALNQFTGFIVTLLLICSLIS